MYLEKASCLLLEMMVGIFRYFFENTSMKSGYHESGSFFRGNGSKDVKQPK